MWPLSRHLGTLVSALVDGQLDEETAERAWAHVMECPVCRRAVQHEGWVKRRLATMTHDEPSAHLLGSLYDLDPSPAEAWAAVEQIERRHRTRRRAGIAAVGAGSLSAAVFGFAALSGATLGVGQAPATTPTSLTRPSPTRTVVAPPGSFQGWFRQWSASSSPSSPVAGQERPIATESRR